MLIKYHNIITTSKWTLATYGTITRVSIKRDDDMRYSFASLKIPITAQNGVSKMTSQIKWLPNWVWMLNMLGYQENCHAKEDTHSAIFQSWVWKGRTLNLQRLNPGSDGVSLYHTYYTKRLRIRDLIRTPVKECMNNLTTCLPSERRCRK